jgi:arylsulfatase A-like enzyme
MTSRPRAIGLRLTAIATLFAIVGCRPSRPAVILVVVDTLRADRVGCAGGRIGLTPFLDSLGASGVVFRNAYSTSSWTSPAVASLFTSRYPSQHRVSTFASRLQDTEVTLGERLRAAGWQGVGMLANFRLTRDLGFAQGFDVWFTRLTAHEMSVHRLGQDAVRHWDRRVARFFWRRRAPLFLYLHPMEPHAPYEPDDDLRRAVGGPPPSATVRTGATGKLMEQSRWHELSPDEIKELTASYDAEVATLDAGLRRVFRRLARRGLLDDAIVIVTADHGEELAEHGGFLHGYTLYEESARVPLIVTGPGIPAGRVVDDPVSLVDVAPTVLALLGLPPEPAFEGRSLLALLSHGDGREVLLELPRTGAAVDPRRHTAGMVDGRLKILLARQPGGPESMAAFDLGHDPHETTADPPGLRDAATALRTRLDERRRTLATRASAGEIVPIDRTLRERLRALGYGD